MSRTDLDTKLRDALQDLVPPVSPAGKWPRVQARLKRGRTGRLLQAAAVPVTLVLILALAWWAITSFGGGEMVVIDDSPVGEVAGSGTTDQISGSTDEAELLETVRELIAFVEAGEIVIETPAYPAEGGPVGALRDYEKVLTGPDVVIFLRGDATAEDLDRIRAGIESWPEVEHYDFVSSEEALELLRQDLGADEILEGIGANVLPASFEIRLAAGVPRAEVAERIAGDPAVEEVTYALPLVFESMAQVVSTMTANATARTPEAEEWLAEHRLDGSTTPVETTTREIRLTGPASFERPDGALVLRAGWGSGELEFGLGEGTPREGPTLIGASPSGDVAAVYDWANERMIVLDGQGRLIRAFPLARGYYPDLDVLPDGRPVLLRASASPAVLVFGEDGDDVTYPLGEIGMALALLVDGEDIWVLADNGGIRSHPVLLDGEPVAPAEQSSRSRAGMAVEESGLVVAKHSSSEVQLTITDRDAPRTTVEITSPDLPIDSVRPAGFGTDGTFFVAMRIYREGWDGTESWYLLAVGPDGSERGRVRLPLDCWAGGDWDFADEAVFELLSSEGGVEIIRYPLASSAR